MINQAIKVVFVPLWEEIQGNRDTLQTYGNRREKLVTRVEELEKEQGVGVDVDGQPSRLK